MTGTRQGKGETQGQGAASSIRPRCGATRLHLAMHGRSSGRTWKGEGKRGRGREEWVDGGYGEHSCHGRVFEWGKGKRRTGQGNRWSLLPRRLADRETPITIHYSRPPSPAVSDRTAMADPVVCVKLMISWGHSELSGQTSSAAGVKSSGDRRGRARMRRRGV